MAWKIAKMIIEDVKNEQAMPFGEASTAGAGAWAARDSISGLR